MRARPQLKAGKLATGFPSQRDEAVLNCGGIRTASMLWSFASDGGAVGSIQSGRLLPAGAVVTGVIAHEIASVTSGGSLTVQVQAGSTDLTDAVAVADLATGAIDLASSATAIPLASAAQLQLALAGAAATAGTLRVYVQYLLPTDV